MKVRAWNEDFTAPVDYVLPGWYFSRFDDDELTRRINSWNKSVAQCKAEATAHCAHLFMVCTKYNVPKDIRRKIYLDYLRPVPKPPLHRQLERKPHAPWYSSPLFPLFLFGSIVVGIIMFQKIAAMLTIGNNTAIRVQRYPPGFQGPIQNKENEG
jgi:hypothetical protein